MIVFIVMALMAVLSGPTSRS